MEAERPRSSRRSRTRTRRLLSQLVRDLEEERARSRQLLLNVLPERIVERLEAGESPDRRWSRRGRPSCSATSSGFTEISAPLAPAVLVDGAERAVPGVRRDLRGDGRREDQDGRRRVPRGRRACRDAGIDGSAAVAETALRMVEIVASAPVREGRLADPDRHPRRPDRRRRRRDLEVRLRRLGRHGEHGEPARDDVRGGADPRLGGARAAARGRLRRRARAGMVDLKGKGTSETYWLLGRRDGAT